jgi:hypothetical protein
MTVRFILTVKNRVSTAVRGLDDLVAVLSSLPERKFEINVFDDSSESFSRREFELLCASLNAPNVRCVYHGSAAYRKLQQQIRQLEPTLRAVVRQLLRPPGSRNWDHAGILNVAFLTIAVRAEPTDTIVLMDDDIRLRDSAYEGRRFRVRGERMIQTLLQRIESREKRFAGCGYWGRRDVSTLIHEKETKARLGPSFAAWILDRQSPGRSARRGAGPHGLSFGLLALRANLLSCAPLLRHHNEDWIWLRLLGPGRSDGVMVRGGVLHAPIASATSCDHFKNHHQEFLGEILFAAIERCLTGADSFTAACRVLDSEKMLSTLRAETDRAIEIHRAWWLAYTSRGNRTSARRLRRNIPQRLFRTLCTYRIQIRQWPRIVARLRASTNPLAYPLAA